MVIWVNIFQTQKTIEIQLVRPPVVCGRPKYKVSKMAKSLLKQLLSNVIDADHQNSCLFTNKAITFFHHLYGFYD